ncbi:Detected protein of unknown function [Hibiscus syriacus]|uniref:Uncharacterized protein n=1 Tax=Hibiscus syriacus TaxID=106335 RepID=A0A6A3BAH3_HIBSY|nr:uncharacterized protein LOC120218999 isoform X2 [Hibiscus syriacus]KAE8713954.1 Detected protein of unknown function [Hibiscus syriacus]
MRPSSLAVSFMVLFIFLSSVQGIRLEKSFKSSWHPKLHEEAFMQSSNGVVGDVIFCKEGHCTGNSRKLLTATTAIATSTSATGPKSEDSGDNKANPTSKVKSGNQENGGKQEKVHVGSPTTSEVHDQYADIMEIAEMDYSPAKRKPPIHN